MPPQVPWSAQIHRSEMQSPRVAIEENPHSQDALIPFRASHFQLGLCSFQNRKYLCASGSTWAGSHVSNSPFARTSYVSGSTVIFGNALFHFKSRLLIFRQPFTASTRLVSP